MTWEEAMAVLVEWEGEEVIAVPFLGPGLSVGPYTGRLDLEQPRPGLVRLHVGTPIALPRSTFIEADWVPGQEQRGVSIVQGGTRVDVFLDGT